MGQRLRKESKREAEAKFAELQSRVAARLSRIAAPTRTAAPAAKLLEEFDTRARQRVVAEHPALVICETEEDTPATIVDMSADGLRLRFAKPRYLPSTILIDSPAFAGFVVAEVKWRNGAEAGVAFDHIWTEKLAASYGGVRVSRPQ